MVLEEKTSVAAIVTAEQQHVLDAIAVRNMKTRKSMSHQVSRVYHDFVYAHDVIITHAKLACVCGCYRSSFKRFCRSASSFARMSGRSSSA